jgi:SAM-dependent methyltransferase
MTGRTAEPGREAYLEFAFAYDQALGRRFLASFKPLLRGLLRRHPPPSRRHVDLACGTGLALEFFARSGYRSVGVDGSVPMLTLARTRGRRLVAGDLRELPLRGHAGLVTCLYDSLNHMLERDALVAAFRAAGSLMESRSVFVFDMNHPDVYPRTWGLSEPFVSADADHRLILDTRYLPEDRLGIAEVSGWAGKGPARVQISETHRQRAYAEEEVRDALEEAGLGVRELVGFDPFLEGNDGSTVKMVFVAGKK